MDVRRKEKRQGPTKYKECNVLLLAARYTFHRISPGDVPWNNKDKNAGEKEWMTGYLAGRAVYVAEYASV